MEEIQITEEDIKNMVEEAVNEIWLRSRKEPLMIGGRTAPKLDISGFIRKDEEMSSVIWRNDLNAEKVYFTGHVVMNGNKLTDIRILDYDLEFTGRKTDEWIDGTREIRDWFDDLMDSPYVLERWDLLEMIRRYIKEVYRR